MDIPSREYDPRNRPRFNEWVRVGAVPQYEDADATEGRDNTALETEHKRPSVLIHVWRAAALVIGLAGGFAIGHNTGYQQGYAAGTRAEQRIIWPLKHHGARPATGMTPGRAPGPVPNGKYHDPVASRPGLPGPPAETSAPGPARPTANGN